MTRSTWRSRSPSRGYQCRITRATAVELSLNDYRPFELPLAIPIGRLLLRGDLLEGQRDGFCHVIYGRSSGIANTVRGSVSRSRQFVHGNANLPDQLAQLSPLGWRLRGLEPASPVAVTLASGCSSAATAMHATSSIWHRGRNPVPRRSEVPG
jgi:hypothetical protein